MGVEDRPFIQAGNKFGQIELAVARVDGLIEGIKQSNFTATSTLDTFFGYRNISDQTFIHAAARIDQILENLERRTRPKLAAHLEAERQVAATQIANAYHGYEKGDVERVTSPLFRENHPELYESLKPSLKRVFANPATPPKKDEGAKTPTDHEVLKPLEPGTNVSLNTLVAHLTSRSPESLDNAERLIAELAKHNGPFKIDELASHFKGRLAGVVFDARHRYPGLNIIFKNSAYELGSTTGILMPQSRRGKERTAPQAGPKPSAEAGDSLTLRQRAENGAALLLRLSSTSEKDQTQWERLVVEASKGLEDKDWVFTYTKMSQLFWKEPFSPQIKPRIQKLISYTNLEKLKNTNITVMVVRGQGVRVHIPKVTPPTEEGKKSSDEGVNHIDVFALLEKGFEEMTTDERIIHTLFLANGPIPPIGLAEELGIPLNELPNRVASANSLLGEGGNIINNTVEGLCFDTVGERSEDELIPLAPPNRLSFQEINSLPDALRSAGHKALLVVSKAANGVLGIEETLRRASLPPSTRPEKILELVAATTSDRILRVVKGDRFIVDVVDQRNGNGSHNHSEEGDMNNLGILEAELSPQLQDKINRMLDQILNRVVYGSLEHMADNPISLLRGAIGDEDELQQLLGNGSNKELASRAKTVIIGQLQQTLAREPKTAWEHNIHTSGERLGYKRGRGTGKPVEDILDKHLKVGG